MNTKIRLTAGVAAVLLVASTAGYSWNYATHAYIAGRISTLIPVLKSNQVYGIMSPDIFNLDFSLMDDAVLRGFTHGVPPEGTGGLNEDFLAVWQNADGPFQKAAALGYLGHNDAWGADYIAHWHVLPTLPPPFDPPYENEKPGYIIILAIELDKQLAGAGVWASLEAGLGITLSIDERMMFTENVIEFAGDIMVWRADPGIGQKLIDAASVRTPSFWALLHRAFPKAYKPTMKAAEEAFQRDMIQFGALLLTDESTIKQAISQQMAMFAIQYLAYKMNMDPEALYPTLLPVLLPVTTLAVDAAVQICEGADYMAEVDATADFVAAQLESRHLTSKLLR